MTKNVGDVGAGRAKKFANKLARDVPKSSRQHRAKRIFDEALCALGAFAAKKMNGMCV